MAGLTWRRTPAVRASTSFSSNRADPWYSISYALVSYAGRKRFILSLGTDSAKIAANLLGKINQVVAAPGCPTWLELAERLPARTFAFLTKECGYQTPAPAPFQIETKKATWQDLRTSYEAELTRKILDGEMVESTKTNYLQSLKEFDAFVLERGYASLDGITEDVIVEEFKPWRKKRILKSKNAKARANRFAFDQTILRAAFNHMNSRAWKRAGFSPMENPVPGVKRDQKPGANPEDKTMPFTSEELAKLEACASLNYVEDSTGRKYALKYGTDSLALSLLRRSGLRRCDAATLQWKHIRFDMGEGMIQVNAKKNGEAIFLPIHKDLGPLLRKEKARRNPRETDTVLISPETGKAYDSSGKRLYARLLAMGERVGVKGVRPHRFRCTFAVDSLLKGANVNQIAEWLGDTVETVVKHYLPISTAMSESTRSLLDREDAGIDALKKAPTVQARRSNVA